MTPSASTAVLLIVAMPSENMNHITRSLSVCGSCRARLQTMKKRRQLNATNDAVPAGSGGPGRGSRCLNV